MKILQSLSLIVALTICYLLFFRSQPVPEASAPTTTTPNQPAASAAPRTQYKADLDQARRVANQVKANRGEADSSF